MSNVQLEATIQNESRLMKRLEEIQHSEDYELIPGAEALKVFIPGYEKSKLIEKNAFNQWMIEMLTYGVSHKQDRVLSIVCPVEQRCVQYLDIDHFNKFDSFIDFRQYIKTDVIPKIEETIENFTEYYILTFYPEDIRSRCERRDCGAHIYIVFNEVKTFSIIEALGERLSALLPGAFDLAPWKSSVMCLPFSHKKFDSSKYILEIEDCCPCDKTELIDAISTIPFITHAPVLEDSDEQLKQVIAGNVKINEADLTLLKDSFASFDEIHHYQNAPISQKCALLSLCGSINTIENPLYRRELFEAVQNSGKLTTTATQHINEHMNDTPTNLKILIELIEYHAPNYYHEHLKEFDEFRDKLSTEELNKFKPTGKIQRATIEEIAQMKDNNEKIIKVLESCRFLVNHSTFIEYIDRSKPTIIRRQQLVEKLETIFEDNNLIKSTIKLIKTKAYDPVENIGFDLTFNGWKYDTGLKTRNYDKNVKAFNDALSNVFTTEETRGYFLHWVNYILHHPGLQTSVIILIQGRQGTGKTFLAEIIADIMSGYSIKNGSIEDLTGRFNIHHHGVNLYVANEIKNANQSERWVYNKLKSKTTENSIPYEEKGITTFMGQNSLNIIGMSNNARPLLPDICDRRIFNVKTSSLNANNKTYWAPLYKIRNESGFLEDITYYIKSLFNEDEEFLTLPIPQTQAKVELITSGLSNLNKLIYSHFNVCAYVGISRNEFKEFHKDGDYEQKESNMWGDYVNMCDCVKHHNVLYYTLKSEEVELFNNVMFDTMEKVENLDDDEEEQPDDTLNEWVMHTARTANGFDYILASDLIGSNVQEKQAHIDYLLANGWKFDKHLGDSRTKRGYKLTH